MSKDNWMIDRIYDRYLSHLAYRLSDETCDRVWHEISAALGSATYPEIRKAMDEAKAWADLLTL